MKINTFFIQGKKGSLEEGLFRYDSNNENSTGNCKCCLGFIKVIFYLLFMFLIFFIGWIAYIEIHNALAPDVFMCGTDTSFEIREHIEYDILNTTPAEDVPSNDLLNDAIASERNHEINIKLAKHDNGNAVKASILGDLTFDEVKEEHEHRPQGSLQVMIEALKNPNSAVNAKYNSAIHNNNNEPDSKSGKVVLKNNAKTHENPLSDKENDIINSVRHSTAMPFRIKLRSDYPKFEYKRSVVNFIGFDDRRTCSQNLSFPEEIMDKLAADIAIGDASDPDVVNVRLAFKDYIKTAFRELVPFDVLQDWIGYGDPKIKDDDTVRALLHNIPVEFAQNAPLKYQSLFTAKTKVTLEMIQTYRKIIRSIAHNYLSCMKKLKDSKVETVSRH